MTKTTEHFEGLRTIPTPGQLICESCQKQNCQCRAILTNPKQPIQPFTEPETEDLINKVVSKHIDGLEPTEQPNQNLMIFEQINDSIEVALELLGQLVPKTEQVDGCIRTLKSWQGNNLKYLQKAFE